MILTHVYGEENKHVKP
jgi:hypothetical protein